ncbi:MAG: peptide-methionine (S)-S-oxide reductase MsrA [Patescibacteria group bacterium]|nr:peptide-methionine (S)-S-oxide reductase MsrA [Patescibacteria group bacterium]
MIQTLETAYFGSGCFWCTEAIFKNLKGVVSVVSGYGGGNVENPSYEAVSSGKTGHAECAKIEFNPSEISYEKLAEVFFLTHDPATLNRQGNDVGEQYRSIIFYLTGEQKSVAEKIKTEIEKEGVYPSPIITQIEPFKNFFPAENYHQNYFENNPNAPYCQVVINPKIAKFRQKFSAMLKS